MKLSGWSKYPIKNTEVLKPKNENELIQALGKGQLIARGNGRSYGDSSIGLQKTIDMKNFNRIISFDNEKGYLIAESGVILKDIIKKILPHGWFPYVTPGTKFATLGGMIAANIHGKNHHIDGNFSNFVQWVDLINSDGKLIRCSKNENSEIFEWTTGGMGLTGIILKASIKLRPIKTAWIKQKVIATKSLDETINLFESFKNATYSVAWIDCLQKNNENIGRSIFTIGEHAELEDLDKNKKKTPFKVSKKINLTMPIYLPSWVLNVWTIKIFNFIYYWSNKIKKTYSLIDWDSYFYPLDKILEWNKMYGRRGFAQFQCVIPKKHSRTGLLEILKIMSETKIGSFLTVLKKFGPEQGKFSFPMDGYTIAMDFPINNKTLALMNRLDDITSKYGGRIYLAKDSRMSKDTLFKTEKRLVNLKNFRKKIDTKRKFESAQSSRLGI